MENIRSYKELRVLSGRHGGGNEDLFELSKRFPPEERYSLTDQMRRASRLFVLISARVEKAARSAHFVSKLSDSEGEAEETRVWVEFAWRCHYITAEEASDLDSAYDGILAQLVNMIFNHQDWILRPSKVKRG